MDRRPGSPPSGALAPLYGREHDLRQLLKLLQGGVRLLTLRGPGGIGKTALARHLAHAVGQQSQPQFHHMQFIDLSAVHDPGQVLGVIAAALPNSEPRGEPEWRIQNFTANRPTLLILDNFEQLLPAAPSLDHLLASAIHLRLGVTSRAALLLHGEVEYPVGPLALPHRMLNAASSGAVQLFVSRVQALTPTSALSEANAPQVMRVCEVLEGVPLALELAAMRTRTYALGDLLTRLEHPLEVLKAEFRDRPERLRSLRAAVQWSYDLLDGVDRAVFECCAVFDGPFTPQALSEVWGSPDVLERAESLLEQSLLSRLETPETLWKMLQPLRELAAEHLEAHPNVSLWRERHARHFLNMIEDEARGRQGETGDHREAYLPHYSNIRAGLVWAVEGRRSNLAYRYLGALGGLWVAFGLLVQEWPLVERVLALPAPEDRATRLRALQVSLDGLNWTGRFQALEARASEVLTLCRELGDVEGMAWANLTLARVARERSQPEQAWAITQRIICDWRDRVGDGQPTRKQRMLHASVHLSGALVLLELGRHAQALEYAQLSCAAFREAGDRVFEMNARIAVGHLLVYLNRRPKARTLLLACLHDAVEGGLRGTVRDALRLGVMLQV
ncbi:AAA family ATPase (plasmid) [Deinococcus sp. D7000]|nr:AAA family ATPase [Deinococcus sp. D7000]